MTNARTRSTICARSDKYYDAFIKDDRTAIKELDDLDVISSNIIQDHVQKLEQFQWFMRSHLID